jgi:hypothetical protein
MASRYASPIPDCLILSHATCCTLHVSHLWCVTASSIFLSAEGDKVAKWFNVEKDVVMPGRPKEASLSDNIEEMSKNK